MTINGKEYPFEPPTHKQVGHESIELTPEEIEDIVHAWAIEYDKQQEQQEKL